MVSEKFTAKERDAETGLDYFGARYFSAAQGRFASADPLGNFVADAGNPQSWNMYSYVWNNPLKNTDPTGLSCQNATHPDGSSNPVDDGDGKGCTDAGVSPTRDQQPPKQGDTSDIAPNPNSTGDPQNPNIQGNTASAKFEPFSISNLYRAAEDYLRTSQVPVTASFGVGTPVLLNSIGPQVSIALIPRTRRLCVSPGFYVTTPGSAFVNATLGC